MTQSQNQFSMIDEKKIAQAKKEIHRSELKAALKIIRQELPESSFKSSHLDLIISRFSAVEKDRAKGVISNENYNLNRNKIISDFLDFLATINQTDEAVPILPNRKYWIIGIPILLLLITLALFFFKYYNSSDNTKICDRLYKSAIVNILNYKKAKECYEKHSDLDSIGEFRLYNSNLAYQLLDYFNNRNYASVISVSQQITDPDIFNHLKGYIQDARFIVKGNKAIEENRYEDAIVEYQKAVSSSDINAETRAYIQEQINYAEKQIRKRTKKDCTKTPICFHTVEKGQKVSLERLSPSIEAISATINRAVLHPKCEPYLKYQLQNKDGSLYKGKQARAVRKFILPYDVIHRITSNDIDKAIFTVECENHILREEYIFTKK